MQKMKSIEYRSALRGMGIQHLRSGLLSVTAEVLHGNIEVIPCSTNGSSFSSAKPPAGMAG
jgi:hypothetical protein